MTNNWEKFKQTTQTPAGESRPPGRKIGGAYRCQFCKETVIGATYYPSDSVLKYTCSEEHTSFIENFKLAF